MRKILILLLLIVGCNPTQNYYDYELKYVRKPNEKEKTVNQLEEKRTTKYQYSDEYIDSYWLVSDDKFFVELWNKTDESIIVDWDKGAYLNPTFECSRIIHKGASYIRYNEKQIPSVILSGGMIDDIIAPSDNLYYSVTDNQWHFLDFIPYYGFLYRHKPLIGSYMSVMLPLTIYGKKYDYTFIFQVKKGNDYGRIRTHKDSSGINFNY